MANFVDRDWLKSIVKEAIGPLTDVSWDYEPESVQGFGGLDAQGEPIPGLGLLHAPLPVQGSGGAVKVTLSIPSWTTHGNDNVIRSLVMGPWAKTGTAPTIVIAGTPNTDVVKDLDVEVLTSGALGAWTGRYSFDRETTWYAFTSGATVDLGHGSGLELQIQSGNAVSGATLVSTPSQSLLVRGLRHFTLSIRVECDASDPHAIAERISYFFQFKSTVRQLPARNMALRNVSDVRDLPNVKWDDRFIRAASIEVFLSFFFEIVDEKGETDDPPNNWIETVLTTEALS